MPYDKAPRGPHVHPASGATGRVRPHELGKRRPGRSSARRRSGLLGSILFVVVLAWAGVASWLAWSGRNQIMLLLDEQAVLRAGYEDKIKALTRRLVGVASHQVLEQDGLSGRLADIISRQVELENQQATLMLMADRAGGVGGRGLGPDAAPGSVPTRGGAGETPSVRVGGPNGADAPPPTLKPRTSLDPLHQEAAPARRPRVLAAIETLPLRDQFGALETSMDRLEASQIRYLGALSAGAQSRTALIQASLATLGVPLQPQGLPVSSPGQARTSQRTLPNVFDVKLTELELEFARLDRWRQLVDTVPLRAPVETENSLTSNFGSRKDPFTGAMAMHAGVDFRGTAGTPVKAAGAGRVIVADVSGGYGNLVEVEHGNGIVTRYAHLSAFNVGPGQAVAPGAVIGLLGSTGRSTGPHLHYETRVGSSPVDPMRFLQAGASMFSQAPIQTGVSSDQDMAFD